MSIGGSAGASTMTVSDPLHDNGARLRQSRRHRAGQRHQRHARRHSEPDTAAFADPSSSFSWLTGSTGIVFNVDTDNDHQPEFFASFGNNGLGPYAVVVVGRDRLAGVQRRPELERRR